MGKTLCVIILAFIVIITIIVSGFVNEIKNQSAFHKKQIDYLLERIDRQEEVYKELHKKYQVDCLLKDIINDKEQKLENEM